MRFVVRLMEEDEEISSLVVRLVLVVVSVTTQLLHDWLYSSLHTFQHYLSIKKAIYIITEDYHIINASEIDH